MQVTILVTGATGNVGTEVVHRLAEVGAAFRVGAHNPEKARRKLGTDIDIVPFDFLEPETFAGAFAGIKRLFLVRPPTLANVQRDIAPAVRAAAGAGVEHVVFLSVQGVEANNMIPHAKIEQLIIDEGMGYTFLRAGFFMQNLSTTHRDEIRNRNAIDVPVGRAKTSFIDVRDIAAVAARCLTQNEHINKKYTLTGAEALDYYQIAEKLSAVLNRPVRYTNPSVLAFVWRWLRGGKGLGYTLVITGLYTATRFGNAAEVSDDVPNILQRAPISFDQFANDYRDSWS